MLHSDTISPRIYNGVRIVNRPDPENVWRVDRGAMPLILEMERNGIRVDKSHVVTLHKTLTTEMEQLSSSVTKLTGREINLGSGDQLADLLFKEMKLKQPGKEKYTKKKTRLAVDSDVLKGMVSQHPCIKPILEWKEREKLRSTYTHSLIAQADEAERVHTDISSTSAATGRLTSSGPNLQNIPVRTQLGKEVRKAFIPSPGNVMGTVDASQIEMRCHAEDSQCPNMLDVFWRWDDLYWATAELMYQREFPASVRKCKCEGEHIVGCPVVIVEPGAAYNGLTYKEWFRFNAKTTTLGVSYDISPDGLADQMIISGSDLGIAPRIPGVSEKDRIDKLTRWCAQAIIDWFKAYKEVLDRRKQHHRRAYKYGYVWDAMGRVRYIPQVRSVHQWIVGEGLRQAGNMPIQGLAADIIKLWMAVVWDGYISKWKQYGIRALMQIHDELLWEGPEPVLVDFLEWCKKVLFNLLPLSHFNCPLESSSAIGCNWGDLEK